MKISIDKIPPEGVMIEENEPAGIIGANDEWTEFKEPVKVSVFASKTGNMLLVTGKIKTTTDVKCSRCLKKFKEELVAPDFSYSHDISGLEEVDLIEEIREEALLLVPIKPLCSKGCKGLCPNCGQNLNEKKCSCKIKKEDIRWADLEKLKFKDNK